MHRLIPQLRQIEDALARDETHRLDILWYHLADEIGEAAAIAVVQRLMWEQSDEAHAEAAEIAAQPELYA